MPSDVASLKAHIPFHLTAGSLFQYLSVSPVLVQQAMASLAQPQTKEYGAVLPFKMFRRASYAFLRKLEAVVEKLDKRQKFCQLSQMITQDNDKLRYDFHNEPDLLPCIKSNATTLNEQHRYYCFLQPSLPIGDLYNGLEEFANVDIICTIFHSDTVAISGRSSTLARLRQYLEERKAWRTEVAGITCTSVDTLLARHFGNGISLEATSSPSNWVPLPLNLHVRTTETTWQKCLFVVFGEDRLHYRVTDNSRVREAILDAWAVRPAVPIEHHLMGRCRKKRSYQEEQMEKSKMSEKPDDFGRNTLSHTSKNPRLRGRKRRHARWALNDGSARQLLDCSKGGLSPVHESRKLLSNLDDRQKPGAPLHVRGRARKHLRRVGGLRKFTSTRREAIKNTLTNLDFQNSVMKKEDHTIHGHCWHYETEDPKTISNNVEVRIHPPISCHYDHESSAARSEDEEAKAIMQEQAERLTSLPVLNISRDKTKKVIPEVVEEIRTYALISYCTPRKETAKATEHTPRTEDELIVAIVVDRDGCIGNLACEQLGEWIKVTPEQNMHRNMLGNDPGAFRLHYSTEQPYESSHRGDFNADSAYWHKFSQFVTAHPHTRRLPYSNGFGNTHSNPRLVRRLDRWGILDVDDVTSNSPHPRSRATWSFNVSASSLK